MAATNGRDGTPLKEDHAHDGGSWQCLARGSCYHEASMRLHGQDTECAVLGTLGKLEKLRGKVKVELNNDGHYQEQSMQRQENKG